MASIRFRDASFTGSEEDCRPAIKSSRWAQLFSTQSALGDVAEVEDAVGLQSFRTSAVSGKEGTMTSHAMTAIYW